MNCLLQTDIQIATFPLDWMLIQGPGHEFLLAYIVKLTSDDFSLAMKTAENRFLL
jgi:hypothetical protein